MRMLRGNKPSEPVAPGVPHLIAPGDALLLPLQVLMGVLDLMTELSTITRMAVARFAGAAAISNGGWIDLP